MSYKVSDLFSLKGKVALVTGGARRLGRDEAEALAEAGADVAITSRNMEMGNNTAKEIAEATGRTVRAYHMELLDEAEVIAVFEKVVEDFGKLDILVNNAGNPINSAPPESRKLEDWNYTFAVNSTGVFLCTREAAKHMMGRKSGVIINIGSESGIIGKDRRQYEGLNMAGCPVDYAAAKGAVISMTRDWAAYLGSYNIRINCLSPAGFKDVGTEQETAPNEFWQRYISRMALGRAGEFGKDMKGPIVFLASEASSWITGQNIVMDGGYTIM